MAAVAFDNVDARQVINAIRDAANLPHGDAVAGDPNEAKLRLAASHGLRAKFAYQGERDYRAVERRLEPKAVINGFVSGESFDQGGAPEGYRQFRLDRIHGPVAIR